MKDFMVAVLAGNYKQFHTFCYETGFAPQPYVWKDKHGRRWRAVYADEGLWNLRGCRFDAYIKYGTWWDRRPMDVDLFHIEKAMWEPKNNARHK
jgi:hypothetical protein